MTRVPTSDKLLRLECIKQATMLSIAFKHPKESVISVAKQFYAFISDEQGPDEYDVPIYRPILPGEEL